MVRQGGELVVSEEKRNYQVDEEPWYLDRWEIGVVLVVLIMMVVMVVVGMVMIVVILVVVNDESR